MLNTAHARRNFNDTGFRSINSLICKNEIHNAKAKDLQAQSGAWIGTLIHPARDVAVRGAIKMQY